MFQALQKDPCQPEEFWLNVVSWLNMTFFVVQGAKSNSGDAAGVEWFHYGSGMNSGELVGL